MRFSKYQGTGNDFIIIEGEVNDLSPDKIKRVCDRRYGVGADGLIFVGKKTESQVSVAIFNADGGLADMCGNGLRCTAQYFLDRGDKIDALALSVGDKRYPVWADGSKIVVEMGSPKILEEGVLDGFDYLHIDAGTSHFVHFCDEIELDFIQVARRLRRHEKFSPSGVNVNFARLLPSQVLQLRTYERGVEDETLSCGTGAAAACVGAWKKYHIQGRIQVEFLSGERLEFDISKAKGVLEGLKMRGSACFVYHGEF